MASQAAQVAGKTTRSMFSRWGQRDPELYVDPPSSIGFYRSPRLIRVSGRLRLVLGGIVTMVFVGLGYYVGSKDKISEQNVVLAKDGKSMPWQQEGDDLFKYKYHPRGNPKNPPKQAPGALHETTVWVRISQENFDRFDKKGPGYQ